MLHEGSTITLIDKHFAHKLGLSGSLSYISLKGKNDKKGIQVKSEKISFELQYDTKKFLLKNAIAVENVSLPSQTLTNEIIRICEKELNIKVKYYKNATPMIIIGQDNWNLIVTREIFDFKNFSFAVSRFELGFCVHGSIKASDLKECQANNEYIYICDKDSLSFKDQALKRLYTLERKLDRDHDYAKLYYREMNRLFECGYAIEMPEVSENVRQWYLPHFGVTRADKPGKLRLVFDACMSMQCSSENLQTVPELRCILLLFRFTFAYSSVSVIFIMP